MSIDNESKASDDMEIGYQAVQSCGLERKELGIPSSAQTGMRFSTARFRPEEGTMKIFGLTPRYISWLVVICCFVCVGSQLSYATGACTTVTGGSGIGTTDNNTVLMLGPTLTDSGGSPGGNLCTSLEAVQAMASPLNYNVEIDDATAWGAKTGTQFATYRAIVLGDPNCSTSDASVSEAVSTRAVWGPVITGPVAVVGTDPVFHFINNTGPQAAQLTQNAIALAASSSGNPGAYISLSCYYFTAPANSPVPVLDPFGTFTVQATQANAAFIVDSANALVNSPNPLNNNGLSNWGFSSHEGFNTFPTNFSSVVKTTDGPALPYILATQTQSLNYPTGTSTQVADYNPNDSVNHHSWKAKVNASTAFSINVTANETACGSGCPSPLGNNDPSDFQCRFKEYFSGDSQLPKPVPYVENGTKCVFYRVENPPLDADIAADILFQISYIEPPGFGGPYCDSLGAVTRIIRDPSQPPPDDAADNHSFAIDFTTGFNPAGKPPDSTISGDTTKTFNDYVVACRFPAGTAVFLKPKAGSTSNSGSAIPFSVQVKTTAGAFITDAATPPNSVPLSIFSVGSGGALTLVPTFGNPGGAPTFWTYSTLTNSYTANAKTKGVPPGSYLACVDSMRDSSGSTSPSPLPYFAHTCVPFKLK